MDKHQHYIMLAVDSHSQEDLEAMAEAASQRLQATAHIVYDDGFGGIVRPEWSKDVEPRDGADWINHLSAEAWVKHVIDEMAPKMRDSAMVMQLVPDDGRGEVKFWVELGAAIMMNKPILAVSMTGKPIPPKLEKIADRVVHLPEGVSPESSQELAEAMKDMMGDG